MTAKRIGWVLVALAVLWGAAEIGIMRGWPVEMPLTVPLSLKPGQFRSPDFSVPVSYPDYLIELEFDPGRIDPNRLRCLLGVGILIKETCSGIPEAVDVSWSILSDGRLSSSGASERLKGIIGNARAIGGFSATAGVRYTILLDIRRDGRELNSANPHLVVKMSPGNYGEFLGPPLALFGAALLAGLGVFITAAAYLVSWFRARKASHLRPE